MPARQVRVKLKSGEWVNTPLVRVRGENAARYTGVKSIPRLASGLLRSTSAAARMQARAAEVFARGEMSQKEYERYRGDIEKKFNESILRKSKQVVRVSERDPKFGMVFNDVTFRKRAADFLSKKKGALVMIDIDRFSEVNNTLGHDAGDVVLRFLAIEAMRVAKLFGGEVGRLGGEEFGVLIPGTKKDAMHYVKRLDRALLTEFERNELYRSLLKGKLYTFSAGISEKGEKDNFKDLLKLADDRLYVSKGANRRRVTYSGDPGATRVIRRE